ncbi:MAG: class I SAM-dependent methyltransferase family protein [Nanoarchaeota archaeon]|nr:class I SAM-dependent methyltransferase family protein [Nanoarchaeota archaeon]
MSHNLKQLLSKELTKKQLEALPTSFDLVGDILVFSDFPDELSKKEKIIGNKILGNFKHVKVICKKAKQYSGTFRTPTLRILAGERRKETTHKESGIRVKLNIEKVYFSARLGHERERINNLVKKAETVLVMFSGCGVYCINIARNTSAKEIYGVEINPAAHKYAIENIKLNKVDNVDLFLGDVTAVLPTIKKKFDRVLMPLPKSAEDFLDIALPKVKKNGILHFYDFLHENNFGASETKIKDACKRAERKYKILNFTKCGQFGPGKYRVCIDARID